MVLPWALNVASGRLIVAGSRSCNLVFGALGPGRTRLSTQPGLACGPRLAWDCQCALQRKRRTELAQHPGDGEPESSRLG